MFSIKVVWWFLIQPHVFERSKSLFHEYFRTSELLDFDLEYADVFESGVVRRLAHVHGRLQALDLLVQQTQLIIPPQQLGSEDVSLIFHLESSMETDDDEASHNFYHRMLPD